ncbi:actin, putative [Perkinsus marinus ATCC 50983]|uniref:Actin, putative n=1 Tax=Perkinsus marinus (strain ATCC 50983 / TXsc) TaxID=423536 RepID=C5L8U6_PERM5|nr:actin, putative [Perkinsus marinus ATCC 50983]EER06804.1 actin, putative [Perkinsus marinus ATCC 50983]|eukprot:XP_002774988.1 actin, putative [Perkinsus marinus ATCC 50983]
MADTPSSTAVATASNDQLVGVGGNSYTRAWMAEVMFEKFNVPAFAVMNTAALSLFSTGIPTGLAVDIGEGVTHATPVFQGFAIPHATFRLDKAGMDITEQLQKLISQRQPTIASKVAGIARSGREYFMYADMKERFCRFQTAHTQNRGQIQADSTASCKDGYFELPDGSIVQIDEDCCLDAPDVYTDP